MARQRHRLGVSNRGAQRPLWQAALYYNAQLAYAENDNPKENVLPEALCTTHRQDYHTLKREADYSSSGLMQSGP